MLQVKRFVNAKFDQNTYVVSDGSRECVLVDCGGNSAEENEPVARYVEENGWQVKHLLCTHFHLDHILGNAFFQQRFAVKPELNPGDQRLVSILDYQAMALNFQDPIEPGDLQFTLEDGSLVSFGNTELKVLHTPGHSPGSICLYSENDHVLLSGDTLMKGAIGSTSLPGGRKKAMARSVEAISLIFTHSFVSCKFLINFLRHSNLSNPS